MSLRVLVFFAFVVFFSIRAWRSYFPSLCALIIFTAFFEHPDMPRSMGGIPGLEFWNLLLVNVTLAWLHQRNYEDGYLPFPRGVKIAFFLYFCVIFVSFARMFLDPTPNYTGTRLNIVLDYLVSPVKFMMPAVILFDACRTRERAFWGTTAIMLGYFFLSLQVVRYMGFHVYSGDELNKRGAKILHNSIGYDRVDIAMMLAGSVWGMIALAQAMQKKWQWAAAWAGAGIAVLAEMLTGGRTGYVACGAVGLVLCVLRWRRLLFVMPLAAAAVLALMPGVRERMLHGFDKQSGNIVIEQDHSEITSGRTTIWPYVIKKINQSPFVGYGRNAMVRTGLAGWLESSLGEEFGHPHNAYLEMLFDNGFIGLICIFPFYFIALKTCMRVFLDRGDPINEAVGGVALSALLALIITGCGAQTLYPREDTIWLWGAASIALRLFIQPDETETDSGEESEPREEAEPTGEELTDECAPVQ